MIVGIDLGTTNSLIAVWREGRSQLIPNSLGEFLTPSCVSIDEDGSLLIGRAALERLQTHPDKSAAVFKRYMGSDRSIKLGKRNFRPEELSALVLKSLRADAEAFLGEPVTEAIITVPAYFSDAQRKATRAAGEIAGLRVERLLNEPTAAALAYGIHQGGNETQFLVFDLGGGTFDVSILELFEGVMEVRSTAGDNCLGGEDFVRAIVSHFVEHQKIPEKLQQDPAFAQQLIAMAERGKHALSDASTTHLKIQHGDTLYAMELEESQFETICMPLLNRLRSPVERALRDANIRSAELHNIVLAGGATRMPLVRRLATRMFGRFPSCDLNPDEVVALGAAVQAGLKMKDAALKEVVMTDVAPYSMGVEVVMRMGNAWSGGHFDPIIERNSPVPISRVKRYFPVNESQMQLELNIFQGEARLSRDNIHLGRLQVDLFQNRPGESGVDVRFTYDVNGLLEVEATVVSTGANRRLLIQENPGLLSDEEIKRRFSELATLKIHPRDQAEHRTLLARAERIFLQIKGDARQWLAQQILAFEHALESQDPRLIAQAKVHIREALDAIERESFLHDDTTD
ncbi:MAG: molecular chaperone HscC [Rhodocyclaceae bacterium]